MKRKFVVTGGAGMIGLEICNQLNKLGHTVHLFDLGEQINRVKNYIEPNIKIFNGSILDLSSLRSSMEGCDTVIHLAALLGVKRTESDMLRCIEINIEGTNNVLQCAVQSRIEKIVFSSSSEVYGEPLSNPINEETITQGKTVYAITKLAGEELCKAYSQRYPISFVILRYFNSYGPYQTAQFVISKFIKNVLNNIPPKINGDGNQMRSYSYVSDTALATIKAALLKDADNKVLNIGNGSSPVTLNYLADIIIKACGKQNTLKPHHDYDFKNTDRIPDREIYERFCDSSKAQKILKWKPEIGLEEGIKKILENGTIFERWENTNDEQN